MATSVYDNEQRELIRTRLLQYAQEQLLKPERLCKKMAEAANRDARFYPRSTLLRFLNRTGTTDDGNVALYEEFLDGLPPPETLTSLSACLASFYAPPAAVPSPLADLDAATLLEDGTYHTEIALSPATLAPYSTLSFMTLISPNCFRIEETVTNPARATPTLENETTARIPYEGTALFFGTTGIALQRHAGTRHARTIHFEANREFVQGRTNDYKLYVSEIPYLSNAENTPHTITSFEALLSIQPVRA